MSTTDTLTINKILNTAAERQATDVHFVVGNYPFIRIKGELETLNQEELITPETMEGIISFFVAEDKLPLIKEKKEIKFVFDWLNKVRFRVHIFQQKGYFSVSLKLIGLAIQSLEELNLPKIVESFAQMEQGLLFITGPFNSGRSTTLAAILQEINRIRKEHILYLEEVSEQLFVNEQSIIEQRQVGTDVESFIAGLLSAKDEDVNVVAVSEVPNNESLEILLELAESGRLVIALLDYASAVSALDGLVSKFNDAKISWARNVLADFLIGIVVQRLVPTVDGEMILAVEVLTPSPSAKALIKEGRFAQLDSIIQTSRAEGMISLDRSLLDLVQKGRISPENALANSSDPKVLKNLLRL